MNMKKWLSILLVLMLCTAAFAGCTSNSTTKTDNTTTSSTTTSTSAETEKTKEETPEGPIEVVYWGTWGSDKQEYIERLATEFNNSQGTYKVVYEYVGNMNDLLAKIQVTDEANLPTMINATTEQNGTYMYSDFIVPVSTFADKSDKYVSMLYGNLVANWGDLDGNLIGYPMGNSMAGIYFNMDMLEKINVNPYTDITCLEDLYDICKKLVDGGVSKYAIGTDHSNIYLNYALSIEGIHCVDNDNGKSNAPTVSYYDQEGVREYVYRYFDLWRKLSIGNYCYPLGSSWGNEILPAFAKGEVAIVTGTIGGYARLANAWNENHDTPCNIAFIPWLPITSEGRATGLPASGHGFYIVKDPNEAARKGAWEFIKYFSDDDRAAEWCTITGYLPISDGCYNSSIYRKYIEGNTLDFQYLIDAQKNSDINSYHPVTPINTEFQAAGIEALENIVADPNYSIDVAIEQMAQTINEALNMWHATNKKQEKDGGSLSPS
jgi:sn-glycerol 3-phosphate transport system substrate-binding protein